MKAIQSGRALVVISSFALILLLARCSPINPSVDKRNLMKQPGTALIKVRDSDGKGASVSLSPLPDKLKYVEIYGEKLREFKEEGKVKFQFTDLASDESSRFVQAYFSVDDRSADLEGFEITVSAIDRDNWVLAVQPDVPTHASRSVRESLEKIKISFMTVRTDELVELPPGQEVGKKKGQLPNHHEKQCD